MLPFACRPAGRQQPGTAIPFNSFERYLTTCLACIVTSAVPGVSRSRGTEGDGLPQLPQRALAPGVAGREVVLA